MDTPTILVISPDNGALETASSKLDPSLYHVFSSPSGAAGLRSIRSLRPDLIIVDSALPDMQGLDVCKETRRITDAGIILMTEPDDEVDLIVGLELGADDSLRKPFNSRELLARIKALLRRTPSTRNGQASHLVEAAGISLNRSHLQVYVDFQVHIDGAPVKLSPNEYRLLSLLMEQPGRIVSLEQLAEAIGGNEPSQRKAKVWVYIGRLRAKIERNARQPRRLLTVRGEGYRISAHA